MFALRLVFVLATMAATLLSGVVAGSWYFHHRQVTLATSAPAIPGELMLQASGPLCEEITCSESRVLTFHVVSAYSEVSFYADLKLNSVSLPVRVKGSTNAISGGFQLRQEGIWLELAGDAAFSVDLRAVQSEVPSRFVNLQALLDTQQFPTAHFTVASLIGISPTQPIGREQSLLLTGTLTLHGVKRDVSWDVKGRWEGAVITALATTRFSYKDFDIPVPKVSRSVSSRDTIILQVQLVAVFAGSSP